MKYLIIILITLSTFIFTGFDKSKEIKVGLYQACEGIKAGDPTIKKPAIDLLFKEGLVGYRILYLEWIAETNPEIREHILKGFSKIGDHKHIAFDFPKDWIEASNRFKDKEKNIRLSELKRYFKSQIK